MKLIVSLVIFPLDSCLSRLPPPPYLASSNCLLDIFFCGGGFHESYSPMLAEGMYMMMITV